MSVQLSTLAGAIALSLKHGEMLDSLSKNLLSDDGNRAKRATEGEYWDYKEILDITTSYGEGEFAKDVLAFHNSKGGLIVVGIDDNFRVLGVPKTIVLDTNNVRKKLSRFIGSEVYVFTDQIQVNAEKCLWLIFVRGRVPNSLPRACLSNGPQDKGGRCHPEKGALYARIGDESKRCIDPIDQARLFAGVSLASVQAYEYQYDEHYFRIFAPHCDRFFGREKTLDDVRNALSHRHPIVALDGVGGVGKSAIAIELTHRAYKHADFEFIISLSHKSSVHTDRVEARQAQFSGYRSFLTECAKVLAIDDKGETETLEQAVLDAMAGVRGLLLVDNFEDVVDLDVQEFLRTKLPDPVKALVTTRVNKNLGALTISIPEMSDDDALALLIYELDKSGCVRKQSDRMHLDSILQHTGRLPLAIKWAAQMGQSDSLAQIDRRLRKLSPEKKEFLTFCFSTMFDSLSDSARNVSLLYPTYKSQWSDYFLSLALDLSINDIDGAKSELEQKGIFLDATDRSAVPRILPLTEEYLYQRWNENKSLSETVEKRLSKAMGDKPERRMWHNLDSKVRTSLMMTRISELLSPSHLDPESAKRLASLALSWEPSNPKILFLNGKADYLNDTQVRGFAEMRKAIQIDPSAELEDEHRLYFANLVFESQLQDDYVDCCRYVSDASTRGNLLLQPKNIAAFIQCAEKCNQLAAIATVFSNLKQSDIALDYVRASRNLFLNEAYVTALPRKTCERVIRLAAKSKLVSDGTLEALLTAMPQS